MCIHIYIYNYANTRKFILLFIQIYIHTHIHTYTHTSYIRTYTYACIHAYMHTCIQTCKRTYIHAYIYLYVCTMYVQHRPLPSHAYVTRICVSISVLAFVCLATSVRRPPCLTCSIYEYIWRFVWLVIQGSCSPSLIDIYRNAGIVDFDSSKTVKTNQTSHKLSRGS